MSLRTNTIISLENNEKYVVLNETMYGGVKYFLVMGVDENKDIIPTNVAIVEEIIDGQEFCIFRIMDDCKETESLLHQNNIMGTSLMKDIAHRHHGNFRVIKKEEGTESLLYIHLGKEHFEKDENIIEKYGQEVYITFKFS